LGLWRTPCAYDPITSPPVGVQHLAADVGGVLARKKHVAGGHLVRLAGSLHRHGLAVLGDTLGVEGGRDQRRPDRARPHGVHPAALLDQRLGERAGEGDDGAASRAMATATARPMPLSPPEISATFPASLPTPGKRGR